MKSKYSGSSGLVLALSASIFLAGLTWCGAALTPVDSKFKSPPEWVASGNGILQDGIYRWGGKEKKESYKITLKKLEEAEYVITGNVKIPNGGSFQLSSGDDSSAEESAAPIVIVRDIKGVRLKLNRIKADGSPVDQSMPFRIVVMKSGIEMVMGPITHFVPKTSVNEDLSILIRGSGAEISGLNVVPLKVGTSYPVFGINEQVNSKDGPVKFAAESLPTGYLKSKGVTFYVPKEGCVDVSASMRDVREPFSNTKAFYMEGALKNAGRITLKIPGGEYGALHLLAFSAGRPDHVPRMTVRIGYYGNGSAILEDTVVNVPLLVDGKPGSEVVASSPVKLADGRKGTLYHLRVPMEKTANVREFDQFDLEFTRDMNTHVIPPDPNIFGKIPAGLPSDVVVLGATLEPSPVTMSYVTAEAGNVFHETQKAEFKLTLKNRSAEKQQVRAFAEVSGPGTGQEHGVEASRWTKEEKVELAPGEEKVVTLDATPGKRGWFSCKIAVEAGGVVVQKKDTTFAVLAPDTRKAGNESPFGVWEFWRPHSVRPAADQIDRLASLMKKGGWRHTYGGVPRMTAMDDSQLEAEYIRLRKDYKINFTTQNLPKSYQRNAGWWNPEEFQSLVVPAIAQGMRISDGYFKVLHESRSSLNLLRRISEYLGGTEYDMPEAEQAMLEKQLENAKNYSAAVKAANPDAKIVLINDYPSFANQYLKRKFPADSFDVIGLEGAMFLRSPERQPDWLCLLGHHQEMKKSMQKYGYNKPIWTTEALYHPAQDGALTLHQQATIYVREAAMAIQLGIERMAAAGIIKDPSSDYHWSNWGSAGFCYRDPEINPKPSYAAYAWLTQAIDQAKPNGMIEPPNRSLHVADFLKPEGSHVYMVWTANGVQKLTLDYLDGTSPEIRDFYGNQIKSADGRIEASSTPLYIFGTTIKAVASAVPVEVKSAKADTLLIDFDKPDQLKPITVANPVLESSWDTPSFKGNIESQFVTEDGASALKVELKSDNDPRKLFPRYTEFSLVNPIKLEGRPKEFVFRVKGNSGWARIMFELVDAKGRVWTSTGNQYVGASNAADPKGYSFVNFEGWQTMRFPIVGMYPGKDQSLYWPDNYNWWASTAPEIDEIPRQQEEAKKKFDADMKAYGEAMEKYKAALAARKAENGDLDQTNKVPLPKEPAKPKMRNVTYRGLVPVDYPLVLTKVIVAMRPHILYLTNEIPVQNQVIYLDNLGVSQD